MPNVNDLNVYLSASDVKDGDQVRIVDAGKFVERDYSKNKDGSDVRIRLEITVELVDGKRKTVGINNTTRKSLVEGFGSPHTEQWVDKFAKVVKVRQNVGGVIKEIVYLEAVKE